ncbi:hypothetical protein SNEBB_006074 [Seison nebaliae]|nr:hypothetical protein SNEBB_006074 [Seison nebaliae]
MFLFLLFQFQHIITVEYHTFCIIGAGPSGVQLGQMMKTNDLDYVIFEGSNTAGNFYTKYPRHRKLISINKRYTGESNTEFNLRHDWNSILHAHCSSCHPRRRDYEEKNPLYFTSRSKKMFPDADGLVEYLQYYSSIFDLNIRYHHKMNDIHSVEIDNSTIYEMKNQHHVKFHCKVIILATGIAKQKTYKTPGYEHLLKYKDMPLDLDYYEGKTVLIIGSGNSGFETAQHISSVTNSIMITTRDRIKNAYQTHYVGDLRAVNNDLLDTYQLKSLDASVNLDLDEAVFVKTESGKVVIVESVESRATVASADIIIDCTGFQFDNSIFRNMSKKDEVKFPAITNFYGFAGKPNIYVGGVASHGVDYKKSAGGFIHGYRYTSRLLVNTLLRKYKKQKWPSRRIPIEEFPVYLMKQLNEVSANYQMFAIICDFYIIGKKYVYHYPDFPSSGIINVAYLTKRKFINETYLYVNLQYGLNFSGPGADVLREDRVAEGPLKAHESNFLHPTFYYYKNLPKTIGSKDKCWPHLPKPDNIHHIFETLSTFWYDEPDSQRPFRLFLKKILNHDFRYRLQSECIFFSLLSTKKHFFCEKFSKEIIREDSLQTKVLPHPSYHTDDQLVRKLKPKKIVSSVEYAQSISNEMVSPTNLYTKLVNGEKVKGENFWDNFYNSMTFPIIYSLIHKR